MTWTDYVIFVSAMFSWLSQKRSSAAVIAYELGKETGDGFQLLRHVPAVTEAVVRSAIGRIKLCSPNDAEVFLPFYEKMKDEEHPGGTFADPGQEKDVLYIVEDGVEKDY